MEIISSLFSLWRKWAFCQGVSYCVCVCVCVCVCRGRASCEEAKLRGPSATLRVTIYGHRNPPYKLIVCTGKVHTTPGSCVLGVLVSNLPTYYPLPRLPPRELRRFVCEATVSFCSPVLCTQLRDTEHTQVQSVFSGGAHYTKQADRIKDPQVSDSEDGCP